MTNKRTADAVMQTMLTQAKACDICRDQLPHEPNPVMAASVNSKLIIIGQAPGSKVHRSGVPWDDPSGRLLRTWMGIDSETFYDAEKVALMPMGFCYPGKGRSGDLPPRPECAPRWHTGFLNNMPSVSLIILIGQYAQKAYLQTAAKGNLTETVRCYQTYLPTYFPLPHPSPRNRPWLKKNPWFESDVLPAFAQCVSQSLKVV